MKAISVLCVVLVFIVCMSVFAADTPPLPAPKELPGGGAHALVIGPADAIGSPRHVNGELAILANVPRTIVASEVEIFIDEVSVGTSGKKPYKVEYDSTKLANGVHVLKAVAKDDSGTQLWSASAKIDVSGGKAGNAPGPSAMNPPAAPIMEPGNAIAASSQPLALKSIYKSDKYGFTIKYPEGWMVRDETASMKSRDKDEFWFVLGEPPIVVNLHCKQLSLETTAEVFAKYNPYVLNWERRAIADSPAFVTTDGKPELKRVVHRIIFIKDGSAWMANCIDTTGEKSDSTARLLETILDSIKLTKPVIQILPVK